MLWSHLTLGFLSLPLVVFGAPSASFARLGIEADLSKLRASTYRAWSPNEDCETNAANAFDQAVQEAKLDSELTEEEKVTFKKHFIKEMLHDCRHDPDVQANWVKDVAEALENEKPAVTEALVSHINTESQGWTARADPEHLTMAQVKQKCGYKGEPKDNSSAPALLQADTGYPETFNTVDMVPACKEVIYKIHNQGTCGSCWAFGTLHAVDGRLCISSKGQFGGERAVMSRGYTTACAMSRDGCQGGNFPQVYALMAKGVPLGGDKGCVPYFGSGSGVDHFDSQSSAPPCMRQCVSKSPAYPRSMADDMVKIPGYSSEEFGAFHRQSWEDAEKRARGNMYAEGPLAIAVQVDSRFQSYSDGIFKNNCNNRNANHITVAYGYTSEYFQTINSWGPSWGNKGHMNMANCEISEWSIPIKTTLPSDYEIPGRTPAPPPPPPPPPAWEVQSGSCTRTAEGCVQSPNFGNGNYGSGERCIIKITRESSPIVVEQFTTESKFDVLTVNGKSYSGPQAAALDGVVPTGEMRWSTNDAETKAGWKLCPEIIYNWARTLI
jgi:cathepsin B